MTPNNSSNTASLRIERQYDAAPERVFKLLRQPANFARFLRAPCDLDCQEPATATFEPGGAFEVPMLWKHGRVVAFGRFHEIVADRRIVFDFRWRGTQNFDDIGDTLVTIELEPRDGGTWLTLTHAGFTSASARDEHRYGWSICLDQVGSMLDAER